MSCKCRHAYCPNRYSDVVGQRGWTQHPTLKGAECIPCLYANQMVDGGQSPEQIELCATLMQMFAELLDATGWKWSDVQDAYARVMRERNLTPRSGRGRCE